MEYIALSDQQVGTLELPRDEALAQLVASLHELAKTILTQYPQISLLFTSKLGWIELDIPKGISIEELQVTCHCRLFESKLVDKLIDLELLKSKNTAL